MEDVYIRSRYPRTGNYSRRKRKGTREANTLNKTILRQVIISLVILGLVLIIKGINAPVTNYLTGKTKEALTMSMDLQKVYSEIEGFLGIKTDGKSLKPDKTDENGVVQVSASVNDKGVAAGFIKPVEGEITSKFGTRVDVLTKIESMHYGIDINAGVGTAVKAAAAATVAETGNSRTYGNYIKLDHGNSLTTIYAHCSIIMATKGSKVKQGDVIAEAGNTGRSVGSHLHFEIWKDGIAQDPLNYINYPSN